MLRRTGTGTSGERVDHRCQQGPTLGLVRVRLMRKGMCLHLCVYMAACIYEFIWQPTYVPIWQPAFMYLLRGSLRLGDDYIMLYLCVACMTVLLM